MLENNLEDTENEYEEKLTMYKKKYNDAQRENLELQKRIRDLQTEGNFYLIPLHLKRNYLIFTRPKQRN